MKKKITTLVVFAATVIFMGANADAAMIAVKKVIEVPGAKQGQMVRVVGTWTEAHAFNSSANDKTGIIAANGEIAYPSPQGDRAGYKILFKVNNKVQNGNNVVTFEDFGQKTPMTSVGSHMSEAGGAPNAYIGGKVEAVKPGKDSAAVKKAFNKLADNLDDYMHGKTSVKSAMENCPDRGMQLYHGKA